MRKIGYWLSLILIYVGIFWVASVKFMPTPEMLKARVKGWTSVVVEENLNLNKAIVKYVANYQKVDFVSLRDLILIENPHVKQNVQYNIWEGDVIRLPQIR